MDIEGAEVDIVFGGGELDGCRQLIVELHPTSRGGQPCSVNDMTNHLVAHHGFSISDQHGPVVVFARS